MPDRNSKILLTLDVANLRGAEIGPLDRPLVLKSAGSIVYIDHCDTQAMREKYAEDNNVDISKLHVDAVWGDKDLTEALRSATDWSETHRLDYVLASHVIEHVPDMIGWLREIHATLSPTGSLRLAVPDRRYTFDFLRRTSSFAEVLEAYVLHRRVPSASRVLDFTLNMAPVDLAQAWRCEVVAENLVKRYTLQQALERALDAEAKGQYYDVHCWVFTPTSFAELCIELSKAQLLEFECETFFDTEHHQFEFILSMKPSTDREQILASWQRMRDALNISSNAIVDAKVPEIAAPELAPPPHWRERLQRWLSRPNA